MIYLDTSVLVAVIAHESTAAAIVNWMARENQALISGDWCVTEVASAIALKKRTRQITATQANAAWDIFSEFCDTTLRLMPIDRSVFNAAATLVRESEIGLRAGDALHLALALSLQSSALATLDNQLAASAELLGLKIASFEPF